MRPASGWSAANAMSAAWAGLATGGRVAGGDVGGDGFRSGSGVAAQGAHGGVPGTAEQGRGAGAVLGFVGEHRVPQLVQGPAVRAVGRVGEWAGGVLEDFGGAAVGQPGPA